MIHGLSKHTARAVAAIDYFLAGEYLDKADGQWKDRDPAPKLLEGDPLQMRALCDSLTYKNKYTSGVLSFSQAETDKINATPGLKEQLIEELREFAYAGFKNDDSKPLLVVEHSHTGRLELHYLIPRVSLESGLYFNPFPPNYDGKRGPGNNQAFIKQNDAFVDAMCERYGLQSPRDPAIERQVKPPIFEPNKGNASIRQQVVEALDTLIDAGLVKNREQMCEFLEGQGATITRKGDDYFSFKFPEMDKAVRLKGEIYGKSSVREIGERQESRQQAFESSRSTAESRFAEAIAERQSEVEGRHGKRTAEADAARSADPAAAHELRSTIQSLEGELDGLSSRVRADAAAFCAANAEIMNLDISSADITEPGSTGDPVLDKIRREYHRWLQQCEAEAARYRKNIDSARDKLGNAFVGLANFFISTLTGKNFCEPMRKNISVEDLSVYRKAVLAELSDARAEFKELQRNERALENVSQVSGVLEQVENMKSESPGLQFNSRALDELAERWRTDTEQKKPKRHRFSDYEISPR